MRLLRALPTLRVVAQLAILGLMRPFIVQHEDMGSRILALPLRFHAS